MHDGSKECQCGARAGADRWLENLDALVGELNADQHFCCSQTVLAIGMRRLGIDDPPFCKSTGVVQMDWYTFFTSYIWGFNVRSGLINPLQLKLLSDPSYKLKSPP